jgi:hypothetical protein
LALRNSVLGPRRRSGSIKAECTEPKHERIPSRSKQKSDNGELKSIYSSYLLDFTGYG